MGAGFAVTVVDAEAGADSEGGGVGFELKAPTETNVDALPGARQQPGQGVTSGIHPRESAMKDLHALWSQWTHPGSPGPVAPSEWASRQASAWQAGLDAGRQWWSWWVAAAATPWLRQPWPHAGQVEEPPDASPANSPIPKAMAAHPPAAPARHTPPQRAEHKSRHLQRRKINPG